MTELVFKTEVYEGPLDLLLALIAKNKMDIFDIRISVIFDQYMDYVSKMEISDMEIAGSFITMASELMLIKSRMLLPKQEEDPRDDLVRALMEYKTAKELAAMLGEREQEFAGRYQKDTDEIKPDPTVMDEMDSALLSNAMRKLLLRMADREQLASKKPIEAINPIIKKKIVPVEGRIIHVIKRMVHSRVVNFEDLFDDVRSRSEIVATFFAILQLLKANRIVMEKHLYDDGSDPTIIFTLNREHHKPETDTEEQNG